MKRVILITTLLASLAALSHGQNLAIPQVAAPCQTLHVSGLKAGEGTLMMTAYGSADAFFKKPVWIHSIKVDKESMTVPICNVDATEIAITAFQDMNGNGKLDSNLLGIPSEPYGASGTPAQFGAPTWSDTKVAFAAATQPIVIKF
jgi:uncharacterized protein (DUF2141 family)